MPQESRKPSRLTQPQREIDLLYKDEVYKIVGAAIEVHRELGPGFSEGVLEWERRIRQHVFRELRVLRGSKREER
jgi:hypothetical protein